MSGEQDFEKLRMLAYKLRCLAHFIETQDPNHVCPSDFDEVQYDLIRIFERDHSRDDFHRRKNGREIRMNSIRWFIPNRPPDLMSPSF
jgi:hypothetical protein